MKLIFRRLMRGKPVFLLLLSLELLLCAGSAAMAEASESGAATDILTEAEQSYAEHYGNVVVIGSPKSAPLEYLSYGTYIGVMPMFFERLSEITGMSFTYLAGNTRNRFELAATSQGDIVSVVADDADALSQYGLTRSAPCFRYEGVEYCLAYTASAPKELQAIIDKAILAIPESEKTACAIAGAAQLDKRHMSPLLAALLFGGWNIALILLLCLLISKNRNRRLHTSRARTDTLTGMHNLSYLRLCFEKLLKQRQLPLYALAYVDINAAKLREYFGDAEINEYLCTVGALLQDCMQPEWIAARVDNEYAYAICFPADGEPAAVKKLSTFLHALRSYSLQAEKGYAMESFVGVCFCELTHDDLDETIAAARIAAEAAGTRRAAVVICDEEMIRRAQEAKQIKREVLSTLRLDEFIVYVMPSIDIQTGRIISAEALVRWEHPERGLLTPAAFLPLLERYGQIEELNERVLERMCHWIQAHREPGKAPVLVSCNISTANLHNNAFLDRLSTLMRECGVTQGELGIEIRTDGLRAGDTAAVAGLEKLRAMGLTITADNFGGAHTFVSALTEYPVDRIKLDRSLLTTLPDKNRLKLLLGLIRIGHSVGMRVHCEGIESQTELRIAQRFHCDEAAGYFLYRPMPCDEFDRLLRQQ